MEYQPVVPKLEHLFRATVTLMPPAVIGRVSSGERRMVPITGGTFTGNKLSGKILSGGADWQVVHADGSATLDAHYLLQTDDNALIYIHNHGFRSGPPEILQKLAAGENVDPASYYFRTSPVFETGFPKYSWLNTIVGICSAVRKSDAVIIDFYAVQ